MKTLTIGQKAPSFQAVDTEGKSLRFQPKGSWTYLSFHRFAACPFCNLRTHELIKAYPAFETRGIAVLSIWPSSREKMDEFVGRSSAPFLLLCDEKKKIYQQYGVSRSSLISALRLLVRPHQLLKVLPYVSVKMKMDANPTLLPASFLVDPNGNIALAHYGKDYGDHPALSSLFQIVDDHAAGK